jgi:HSP90 family molecular chaperone
VLINHCLTACRAVLFVPKTSPHDFYDKYYEKGAKGALKLYVRRVFITGSQLSLVDVLQYSWQN